ILSSEGRAMLARFEQSFARYEQYQRQIVDLVGQGRLPEAITLTNGEMNRHASDTSAALRELLQYNQGKSADAALRSESAASNAVKGVILAMLLAAVVTVVLAMLLTR